MTVRVEANAPERRELVQALLAWATTTRHEAGVQATHVYEDLEAGTAFCLMGSWEDQPTMEAHVKGQVFGVLLGALELLARPLAVSVTQLGDESARDALGSLRRLREDNRQSQWGITP